MAVNIILPPAETLEAAAAELRASADPKRQALLDKALFDLLASKPVIIRVSGAALIPSSSRGGLIHRLDDVQGCSCEAGRAGRQCRHQVTIELIEQANTHTLPALALKPSRVARRRVSYEQALAEMDELFA